MAAGLGFKTFNTGDVLSAADVNGYLMQGVLVFADATARDAAITSPQEGQFAYTKDNNSLWYYSGSAWVASGATGDIEGVTAGVGISGGGTSGTVTVTNSMATAIDAKGDLVVGTGADTFSKLTVGANGTILTADSAEATGLKWAAPAAGGLTLLSTTTASGASTVISSINQTYTNLYVTVENLVWNTSNSSPRIVMNGGSIVTFISFALSSLSTTNLNATTNNFNDASQDWNRSNGKNFLSFRIFNYSSTVGYKSFLATASYEGDSSNGRFCFRPGGYATVSALDSLTLELAGGQTMTGGTIKIYGEK
jgi:hypothetical protein